MVGLSNWSIQSPPNNRTAFAKAPRISESTSPATTAWRDATEWWWWVVWRTWRLRRPMTDRSTCGWYQFSFNGADDDWRSWNYLTMTNIDYDDDAASDNDHRKHRFHVHAGSSFSSNTSFSQFWFRRRRWRPSVRFVIHNTVYGRLLAHILENPKIEESR